MTDVFLERTFDPSISEADVHRMVRDGGECMRLHQVAWQCSFLGTGGRRMLCWFRAPDAESARMSLRQVGADVSVCWPGTVHDAADPGHANVLVERRFEAPVRLEDVAAIEDAAAGCLETYRVTFVRSFFARDRKRMICLYHAPDAESVRAAQREGKVPHDRVWAFRAIRPADVARA